MKPTARQRLLLGVGDDGAQWGEEGGFGASSYVQDRWVRLLARGLGTTLRVEGIPVGFARQAQYLSPVGL